MAPKELSLLVIAPSMSHCIQITPCIPTWDKTKGNELSHYRPRLTQQTLNLNMRLTKTKWSTPSAHNPKQTSIRRPNHRYYKAKDCCRLSRMPTDINKYHGYQQLQIPRTADHGHQIIDNVVKKGVTNHGHITLHTQLTIDSDHQPQTQPRSMCPNQIKYHLQTETPLRWRCLQLKISNTSNMYNVTGPEHSTSLPSDSPTIPQVLWTRLSKTCISKETLSPIP